MTDAEAVKLLKQWRNRQISKVRGYLKVARELKLPKDFGREELVIRRKAISAFGRAIRSLEGKASR